MTTLAGPVAAALNSLSESQVNFLKSLPKSELHAHLNGSIPLTCLQALARERTKEENNTTIEMVSQGLHILERGMELTVIDDFFALFPAIYALTSSPRTLRIATREVLSHFLLPDLDGGPPQCRYMELRTTPRHTEHMTREEYLAVVLDEIDEFPPQAANLLVSIDRRMSLEEVAECVDLAVAFKNKGRRVVGIDLCGDPMKGDMASFLPQFFRAKSAGLNITLHISEVTTGNSEDDTMSLLSFGPTRLGHATFLSPAARDIVLREKIPIEICLSSNLLCKTVNTIEDHHLRFFLERNHPIAICTDDVLLFRNSLLGEYALLMAMPPLGLGLGEIELRRIADMSQKSRFVYHPSPSDPSDLSEERSYEHELLHIN